MPDNHPDQRTIDRGLSDPERVHVTSSRRTLKLRRKIARLTPACNENVPAANEAVVGGSFSILQPGAFEVPYGEYGHGVGLQLFDRESAVAMANELSGLLGRLTRGFRGVPVYAGHPDHHDPRIAAQYPDRRARGWIKEIIPGESSARFVVAYNELGKGEVEDAQWAGYSPYWLMRPAGAGKFRPMILKSMALTNNPNIPVPPLVAANEKTPDPETSMLKPLLKAKLLKLLGLTEEVDDEAFDAAANQYCDAELAKREKPEKPDDAPPASAANEAVLTALRQQIEAAVSAANDQANALRAARIDLCLDAVISAGRLPAAERDGTRTRLLAAANETELQTQLSALRSASPRMQTSATFVHGLAAQRPATLAANEAADRTAKRNQVVDEIKRAQPGISPTLAWGIAANRHPELFSY